MFTSTVSPKGAIVIPKEIRKKYGIKPGCKVQILEIDGNLQLFILPENIIEYACGILKDGSKSAMEMLREGREEDEKHEKFLLDTFGKKE
ncbi:AbrB/MazE/SpoVT family DNA-binding domain-containing protein [candidate division KSB1 bacterium]|nr:AbrB/MazE/SpoVT family DNA-binding domain-containing protein [candidate division KSB1 bacterium]MBL7094058.1 AbrB/MazE/SpoVT family DNA-binding domain-containing protein [candidate division KSB1 bacterium]